VIVTIQDIIDAGFCARGARRWAAEHKYDFRDFLQNGMPVERMESYGDHFCMTVAAHVRNKNKEVSDGQERQ
jgi:hypothetical protein